MLKWLKRRAAQYAIDHWAIADQLAFGLDKDGEVYTLGREALRVLKQVHMARYDVHKGRFVRTAQEQIDLNTRERAKAKARREQNGKAAGETTPEGEGAA